MITRQFSIHCPAGWKVQTPQFSLFHQWPERSAFPRSAHLVISSAVIFNLKIHNKIEYKMTKKHKTTQKITTVKDKSENISTPKTSI